MEQKFYICKHCGNIVAFVKESGVPVNCCGEKMQRLEAGVTDAAKEKHYIEWISLQTKQGNQRKCLAPGEKPEVTFALSEGDEAEAAYAYCNLHGLWKN